jgi:hypothetical protein
MIASFNRAQSAYDSAEPADFNDCEHEEWETLDHLTLTSETEDVPIECTYKRCRQHGIFSIKGDTIQLDWDV